MTRFESDPMAETGGWSCGRQQVLIETGPLRGLAAAVAYQESAGLVVVQLCRGCYLRVHENVLGPFPDATD